MTITYDHMKYVLGNQPKADEAIFWYAYAWHRGKGSDLYRVLCESPWRPSENRQFADDQDIIRMFGDLERAFPQAGEAAYSPVQLSDVDDGDVLVAGGHFVCIRNRWPSRVFIHEGQKVVACLDGTHKLRADDNGYVIGFRR